MKIYNKKITWSKKSELKFLNKGGRDFDPKANLAEPGLIQPLFDNGPGGGIEVDDLRWSKCLWRVFEDIEAII